MCYTWGNCKPFPRGNGNPVLTGQPLNPDRKIAQSHTYVAGPSSLSGFLVFRLGGAMSKSIFRGIRLDPQTDRALRVLADDLAQGNVSFLVRSLVKSEAKRRAVWLDTPESLRYRGRPDAAGPEL